MLLLSCLLGPSVHPTRITCNHNLVVAVAPLMVIPWWVNVGIRDSSPFANAKDRYDRLDRPIRRGNLEFVKVQLGKDPF